MKALLLAGLAFTLLSASDCTNKKETAGKKYKGRLEIKGICLNYTIKLLDGDMDTSLIVANWKDESSGKIHSNVFGLKDRCTFPSSIKEGEEFYFTVDSIASEGCVVCEAYYPTPPRSLIIKVLDKQ